MVSAKGRVKSLEVNVVLQVWAAQGNEVFSEAQQGLQTFLK